MKYSTQEENKLAVWLNQQFKDYKNKSGMMTNLIIREKFEQFLKDPQYNKYLQEDIKKNKIKLFSKKYIK